MGFLENATAFSRGNTAVIQISIHYTFVMLFSTYKFCVSKFSDTPLHNTPSVELLRPLLSGTLEQQLAKQRCQFTLYVLKDY